MPTTLTLGRDPGNDITLGDESVSRRHAEVVLLDDRRIFVRDLGGANGTTLIRGGSRSPVEREVLSAGDEIAFGDVVLSFDILRDMVHARLGRGGIAPDGISPDGAATPAAEREGHRDHAGGAPADSRARASAGAADGAAGRVHAADPLPDEHRKPGLADFLPLAPGIQLMRERGLLLPGLIFVVVLSRLFYLLTNSGTNPEYMARFVIEFSSAIAIGGFVVVYRLCGKVKPLTIIAGVMAAEAAILSLHPILALPFCKATGATVTFAQRREALRWQAAQEQAQKAQAGGGAQGGQEGGAGAAPAGQPDPRGAPKRALSDDAARANPPEGAPAPQGQPGQPRQAQQDDEPPPRPTEMPGFLAMLWAFGTCAGLLEELEKMLPVFGLIWAAAASRRPDSRRWGVHEPLDAIVYASAAALAFILIETFSTDSQYVGGAIAQALDINAVVGREIALRKFPLALIRVLDALAGHIAYSGYFAYFVGLGLLRPKHRERYWIGGWIAAAFFHGLYDATTLNAFMRTFSLAIAFFLLIAAILNARKISPTRDENFATRSLPHARRS